MHYANPRTLLFYKSSWLVCVQVVILVTDGYSNMNTGRTLPAADDLKAIGAVIYGIANGDGAQLSELTDIASSPGSQYVLQLNGEIRTVAQTLLDRLCNP